MSRLSSIFTLLYLSQACWAAPQSSQGIVTDSTRIIGGSPTTIEKYPYAVQVNRNNRLICGGTLVSRRCVLSAAHCFVDRDVPVPSPSLYSVRIGSAIHESGGSVQHINTIVVHEQYNYVTIENDIAIMVMRSNVTLGATIGVAQLPMYGATVPDNAELWHIGWGVTQLGTMALVLNEVAVRKVNFQTCSLRYLGIGHLVTSNMICAGLLDIGGADACQGDSGGPLIHGETVVGVTSWGEGCGHPTYPGVSARVANYITWIDTQILRHNASPALSAVNALVLLASLVVSLVLIK